MFVILDTSTAKTQVIIIDQKRIIDKKIWLSLQKHSEELLPAIDKILKKNKIQKERLKGIIVVRGPGSYTSLRVGVACANAIAFALCIPVLGLDRSEIFDLEKFRKIKPGTIKPGTFVTPFYIREPDITKPKFSIKAKTL